jgi:HAD superfamily hydrolase (TIGR01509 family)
MPVPPFCAVVFDFDGVLADTEPLHLAAAQAALASRGATLTREEYYDRYLGFDDEGMFRAFGERSGWTLAAEDVIGLVAEKARWFERALAQSDVLYPGAAGCVRRLAGLPLAIASGALRPEIEAVLARSGLRNRFAAIVASGDTPRSKPAPDPYARAVELLAQPASRCVAIEDSRWGIQSARAAGLRCIAVTHTYPAAELGSADAIVSSLDDISRETLGDLVSW